jgi:signal peptidase II
MQRLRKAALIGVVLCSCVGCDQATKTVAETHLASSQPIHVLGDVLRLQYSLNEGAFLGFGAALPDAVRFWVFTVLVGAALLGALAFAWVSQALNDPVNLLGVCLLIGGGLSNLLDRLLNQGQVVDFMNLGVGNLRTGVFNLADVAIMVGPGILLVRNVVLRRKDPSAKGLV